MLKMFWVARWHLGGLMLILFFRFRVKFMFFVDLLFATPAGKSMPDSLDDYFLKDVFFLVISMYSR